MSENKQPSEKKKKNGAALIDPIYQKFTKGVLRALSSTDFYEFFMESMACADNKFQFSNRKVEKAVDLKWVDAIEETLPAMQNIVGNPRNIIREDEIIVLAAQAKKAGPDVVRHLTQHASFVEDYNQDTGNVRPNKVMQKFREDSEELYENRLVFTTMEMAFHFVKIRHDALFEAMSDEFGAKLKVDSEMQSATEMVHMEMFLHIKEMESAMDADERNADVFARISRLYRLLATFMNTKFAQQMSKVPRVKGTIVKTNVLKKNPNYRKVANLLEFLRSYSDIGYSIRVIEQNPQINETFQRDIFHNIMFNYIVLKGYLEDDSDRVIPGKPKEKQRTLKPKFIKEIIEELTEDYDLPDVEIRKVLIEELTKEQLMREEAEERRRLVEEQQRKKKEEAERLKKEKEAEKERAKAEKEAEKERIRAEKEEEKKRELHERMMREAEDRRRGDIFRKELERFEANREKRIRARDKALEKYNVEKQDFADAVKLLEEAEQRKLEAQERQRKRREDAAEKLRQEQELQAEMARQERARRKEEELAAQAEAERIAREQMEAQIAKDKIALAPFDAEIQRFLISLPERSKQRKTYLAERQAELDRIAEERNKRRTAARK